MLDKFSLEVVTVAEALLVYPSFQILFSVSWHLYLRITDRSVFTRMKDGLAKDDILEMRVNFAFPALVYYS